MKLLLALSIIAITATTACNNKKKSGDTNTTQIDTTISPVQQQKEEELQALTPYSTEQMQALLPAELAGGKLSEPSSGKATGTAYAKGVYSPNDSTMIELSIFDCGGSEGAGFYKFQYLNMLNAEPSSEDVETKTVDYNGAKAIEQFDNNSYRSTFTYLSGRFLVTFESEALDIAGLKKIAGQLQLK